MLLKLNQRHWPRLFLWLKVWYSIWMVFYHIESTLLIELTFQRRKSEGGCSEFLDRLLSVGLLEEEKNSSILWLLKHSYWSKVSLAVQNSSIGDLVTHWLTQSVTHSTFTFDIQRAFDVWPLRHLITRLADQLKIKSQSRTQRVNWILETSEDKMFF